MSKQTEEVLWFEDDDSVFQHAPENQMEFGYKCKAVSRLKEQIESIKIAKKEAVEFYDHKILKTQEQIQFLESMIRGYLEGKNLKSLTTPVGGATIAKRTNIEINTDHEQLIKWLELDVKRPDLIILEKMIDMKKLKSFVKSSGEKPPGWEETPTTSLVIRGVQKRGTESDVSNEEDADA